MTLGPPLWATGSWAVDAWADGSWATSVPGDFGDLTTLFVGYLRTLRNAAPASDVDTEVALDVATVRAATPSQLDDANTMYADYLSV